jgi:hypothetical protein
MRTLFERMHEAMTQQPAAPDAVKVAGRFWPRVAVGGADDCWLWLGHLNSHGYGQIRAYGTRYSAHRLSYMLVRGTIPDGLVLDHLCRNRACANPLHLEAVTNRTNVLRGVGRTAQNAIKTHCLRGHEYTPENTYKQPRDGGVLRGCRQCLHVQKMASKARIKARKLANG